MNSVQAFAIICDCAIARFPAASERCFILKGLIRPPTCGFATLPFCSVTATARLAIPHQQWM